MKTLPVSAAPSSTLPAVAGVDSGDGASVKPAAGPFIGTGAALLLMNEAVAVHHETGLTPRQLADELKGMDSLYRKQLAERDRYKALADELAGALDAALPLLILGHHNAHDAADAEAIKRYGDTCDAVSGLLAKYRKQP